MRRIVSAPLVVLSSFCNAQVPDFVPTDGLVAWYDFANDACDVSGLAGCFELIDGAYIGEAEGSDDLALRLDGNYAELAADSNFDLTEFTIACRYYFDAESQMRIWKGNPQYPDDVNFVFGSNILTDLENFDYSQDCESIIDNSQNGLVAAELQAFNSWLDVVITKSDSGHVSLFTTNNFYTFSGTESICTETQPIRIGHWWNGDPSPCSGWVDHLGVWSTVLAESEVAQLLQRQILTLGCTDESACNYDYTAQFDDESCEFISCLYCLDGTIWNDSLGGCVPNPTICGEGTFWDEETQSCIPVQTCPQDLNYDGIVGTDDLLLLLSTFGFPCQPEVVDWACGDPLTYQDYDYETVLIGGQCWFAENLRTELYQNGDSLQTALSQFEWGTTDQGACSVAGEGDSFCNDGCSDGFDACDEVYNLDLHGRLYNGHVVLDYRQICPAEWHISHAEDWDELESFVVDQGFYATQTALPLKQGEGWCTNSCGGYDVGWGVDQVDEFGFSATAGGDRDSGTGQYGGFFSTGCYGTWWSPSLSGEFGAHRVVSTFSSHVQSNSSPNYVNHGRSIRCVKD